jgi:hypothetical protein
MKVLEGDELIPFLEPEKSRLAADQLPVLYVRNCAVYITRREDIESFTDVMGRRSVGYIMPTERSIDINEMFEGQNGLCYWFNIPLIPSTQTKHPQQPSLDRLDGTKGYIKDNVVLCCYSANIGRNETDIETWKNFISLIFKK